MPSNNNDNDDNQNSNNNGWGSSNSSNNNFEVDTVLPPFTIADSTYGVAPLIDYVLVAAGKTCIEKFELSTLKKSEYIFEFS